MFTKKQIEDGVIDVTKFDGGDFAKKGEVVGVDEFDALTEVVAGKLDKSPMHRHDVLDVDELTPMLNNKLDSNKRYSYTSILSDTEDINYLNNLKTTNVEIAAGKSERGYQFLIDSMGDLKIIFNDAVIASYIRASNSWLFNGVNLNKFINETNEVLQNHYNAICTLAEYHQITDAVTTDGNKFTTEQSS